MGKKRKLRWDRRSKFWEKISKRQIFPKYPLRKCLSHSSFFLQTTKLWEKKTWKWPIFPKFHLTRRLSHPSFFSMFGGLNTSKAIFFNLPFIYVLIGEENWEKLFIYWCKKIISWSSLSNIFVNFFKLISVAVRISKSSHEDF